MERTARDDGRERILFLDIDGPLRPHGAKPSDGGWAARYDGVCPDRMALLNRLVAVGGVQVVVSSTWRSDDATPAALVEQGLALPMHADWRTTLDVPGPNVPMRGWQVDRWLSRRPARPIHAFLDDIDDFHPRQRSRLVKVDPFEGLAPRHVEALSQLLAGR